MEVPTTTEQKSSTSDSLRNHSPKKTYAREVACVLLASLLYFGYVGQDTTLEILVWPFSTFAVAAFGFKSDTIKEAVNGRKNR